MKIKQYVLGPVQPNCFVVYNDQNQAAIIDPGANGAQIVDAVQKDGKEITMVLLTHGHFDHIGGVHEIQEKTNCKVYIHEQDQELLQDPSKNLSKLFQQVISKNFTSAEADVLLKDGDTIPFGEITFHVMHTPGHSRGSCMYLTDGVIFSGDTIFKREIGRNDTYGGDPVAQQKSLQRIAAIPGDSIICTGHGENTTLEEEKKYNPYFPR